MCLPVVVLMRGDDDMLVGEIVMTAGVVIAGWTGDIRKIGEEKKEMQGIECMQGSDIRHTLHFRLLVVASLSLSLSTSLSVCLCLAG